MTENTCPRLTRSRQAVLLIILLLGAVLRFCHLATESLWYDEGATFYVMGLVSIPSRLLDPAWGTEPPLLPVLTWIWFGFVKALLGIEQGTYSSDLAVRLLPCFFSIACIPLTFLVARQMSRRVDTALVAALLVAISPLHIYYAHELRPYASHVFLALCALWCMSRALECNRVVHWAGLAFFLAASLYNHFFTVWVVLAFNVAFVLTLKTHWCKLPQWTLSQLAVIGLAFPAIRQGFVINEITSGTETSWYPPLTFSTGLITFKSFFAGYTPNVFAYYALFAMAAVLAIAGVVTMRRSINQLYILLALSLVPMAANLVVWQSRAFSYYEHRLFIFSAVTFAILIADAIVSLPQRRAQTAVVLALMLFTAPCLADLYAQRLHASPNHRLGVRYRVDNASVGAHIRNNLKSGDVVVHFSHVTFLSNRYYYLPEADQCVAGFSKHDAEGLIASFPAPAIWQHLGAMPQRMEAIAARAKRIWLIVSWWEPFNLAPNARLYSEWLDIHARRLERHSYFGITLYLYDLENPPSSVNSIARVGDFGDFSIPCYLDETADPVPAVSTLPEATPGASPSTLGPEALCRFSVLTSALGTAPEDGSIPVLVQRTQPSLSPDTIRCEIYESAATIVPLAFDRAVNEVDGWYPVVHQDPVLKDMIDPVVNVVQLSSGMDADPRISVSIDLAPDRYAVVARVWHEIAGKNPSRAQLRFFWKPTGKDGVESTIGQILPCVSIGHDHWRWTYVGDIQLAGEGTLTVAAHNLDGLPNAYADMGRIVLLPRASWDPSVPYAPSATTAIRLDTVKRDVEHALVLPPARNGTERFDLLFHSSQSGELRILSLQAN